MGNATSTSVASLPSPLQIPYNTACGQWYQAQSGQNCTYIVKSMCMDIAHLLSLNPQLKSDCPANLWNKYWYCVRQAGKPPPCADRTETPVPCPEDWVCLKAGDEGCPGPADCQISIVHPTATTVVIVTPALVVTKREGE
ncbi:hypothetical protein BJ170DRAFT_593759 [Xylariales sp. AK1849]|nr:hypothetical protein BJ170DRAFT_593759 [Xylariales sp. AK1849]